MPLTQTVTQTSVGSSCGPQAPEIWLSCDHLSFYSAKADPNITTTGWNAFPRKVVCRVVLSLLCSALGVFSFRLDGETWAHQIERAEKKELMESTSTYSSCAATCLRENVTVII